MHLIVSCITKQIITLMQTVKITTIVLLKLPSIFYLLFSLILSFPAQAQSSLHSFALQQVRLLPGIFKDAQETDMKYMLSLDVDRLLAPYLKEAGLTPKKQNYGNWENTGLDGHIGGHYLSALSNMYASTGDARLNERLD